MAGQCCQHGCKLRAPTPPPPPPTRLTGNGHTLVLASVGEETRGTVDALRLGHEHLVAGAVEAMEAALLPLQVSLRLARLARLAAHADDRLGRCGRVVAKLNLVDVEIEHALLVLAHLDPLEAARLALLVVNDPITGGAVSVRGEVELVSINAWRVCVCVRVA